VGKRGGMSDHKFQGGMSRNVMATGGMIRFTCIHYRGNRISVTAETKSASLMLRFHRRYIDACANRRLLLSLNDQTLRRGMFERERARRITQRARITWSSRGRSMFSTVLENA